MKMHMARCARPTRSPQLVHEEPEAGLRPRDRAPVMEGNGKTRVSVVLGLGDDAVTLRSPQDGARPGPTRHPEAAPHLGLVLALDLHGVVGARRPEVIAPGPGRILVHS